MFLCRLAFLSMACAIARSLPTPETETKTTTGVEAQRLEDLEAARNARYYFASDVEDQINDLTQHRDEVRDGLKVRGSFSYSDGFLRREVTYEADENGYRIIKDETKTLPGPKVNPEGTASVRTVVSGASNNYRVIQVPTEMEPQTSTTPLKNLS